MTNVADIAVLSSEAETGNRAPDTGVGRVLFESHLLFDLIDRRMDFSPYKLLILADEIAVDDELKRLIDKYIKGGGKLLLTGKSGLWKDREEFAFDIGGEHFGESPFQPDYLDAGSALSPDFVRAPLVMYLRSQQVKTTSGRQLAGIRNPYFNRTWEHFCSHQHAPASEVSGYAAAIKKDNILYLAHPIFSIYGALGAVAYREYAANAVRLILKDDPSVVTNLPSTARVSLMRQAKDSRYVLHLLHANTILRGGSVNLSPEGYVRDSKPVEVIEDLLPLRDVEVTLRLPEAVKSVTLEPQGKEIAFVAENGSTRIAIDEFTCHQMVVLSVEC